MNEEAKRKLAQIRDLAESGDDEAVVDQINALMIEYPDDPEIGYVFMTVAMKNQGYDVILSIGPLMMNASRGLTRKAEIASYLSSAHFYSANYEEALIFQSKAFFFLCLAADAGVFINSKPREIITRFEDPKITDYLANLLHMLHEDGVRVGAFYGTLLGIIRDQKILPHDKDIDLICNITDLPKVVEWFEKNDYINAHADIFENLRSFKSRTVGICVDIFAAEITESKTKVGFAPIGYKGTDWEYIEVVPKVELVDFLFKGRKCFVPQEPENMLAALYGENWRTPDPYFIPFLEPVGVQDSGLRRFYAGLQILRSWLKGDYLRAIYGTKLLLEVDPFDPIFLNIRNSLSLSNVYWESQND
jgi:hypothetical protein